MIGFILELLELDFWLWIGLIISLIFAFYITVQSLVTGLIPFKVVQIIWLIPITFIVVLFFKGLVSYIQMNKEVGIVLGFLVGIYFVLFPTNKNNKKKSKK